MRHLILAVALLAPTAAFAGLPMPPKPPAKPVPTVQAAVAGLARACQGAPALNTVLGVACAQIERDRQAIAAMQADQAVAAAKAHTPPAAFRASTKLEGKTAK